MHSNLYQLTTEKKGENEDLLREEDLYDNFVGSVADYVNIYTDKVEQNKAIKDLVELLEPYGIVYNNAENSIIFSKGFKCHYFKERYDEFMKKVGKLTLKDFAGDSNTTSLYRLMQLFERKFVYYIWVSWYGTLDQFIRNMQEGQKYFIGSVFDFHM